MDDRRVRLDGPANFRDLGGWETPDGRVVRSGRVYRSDSLASLSDADVRHLVDGLGIATAIDLRARQEVDESPCAALVDAGVRRHHLPIVDETRSGDGTRLRVDRPIAELYLLMLDRFAERFIGVIDVIADDACHPVVFHCAAGKDRTGLLSALILAVLGVDDATIATDYALTAAALPVLVERYRARVTDRGVEVDESLFSADAQTMHTVLTTVRERHGSAEAYVAAHGLGSDRVAALRQALLA